MQRMLRDTVSERRIFRSAVLLSTAMLGMACVLVWILRTDGIVPTQQWQRLGFLAAVVLLCAASGNALIAVVRLIWFYRCPRCGARVQRTSERRPGELLRYKCAACDIEWDTGWIHAPPD
jgi:predicted RNA-binding Zn-ribbon protein involved in translation (DUF1610 family)